jgi:hypothetical protein
MERRIDEQMKQGQSYLTGLQQQLGNQYGGTSNYYSGGFPQVGNIYGWGTTVPHYSQYGPIFSGNRTDVPVGGYSPSDSRYAGSQYTGQAVPRNVSPGANAAAYTGSFGPQQYAGAEQYFNSLFPGSTLSPQMLEAQREALARQGMEVLTNASGVSGKVRLPNGDIIDVIGGAGSGANQRQWLYGPGSPMVTGLGSPIDMSGGGGMGYGGMGPGGSVGLALGDYGDIQNAYRGLFGDMSGRYGGLMNQWGNFAQTGGFSPEDLSNIRSRAVSPIRSIYSTARQGLDRQRALQGGYSPGYGTALGRFSREQGQLTSDAATNAEAAIAEMVQRGKLAGLGGMTSTLGNMGGTLGGLLGGRTSMYGATPGLANMFGNQMLQSMQQQLGAAGLQNQLALGQLGAQANLGQIPGNFDSFINSMRGVGQAAGQIGGAIYPWLPQESSGSSFAV